MFALDTNTVIYFFKNQGRVKDNLFAKSPQKIVIPAIVSYELEVGILKSHGSSQKSKQWSTFIDSCQIVGFDTKEAKSAAKIRVDLEKKGKPIGPIDVLIAATAVANNLTLVTHNTKEFKRVAGLKLEDWY